MEFALKDIADKGIAVLIVGQRYQGKTELVKSFIRAVREVGVGSGDLVYGVKSPFPIIVHAPRESALDDYSSRKTGRALGIRRCRVDFKFKNLRYLLRRYREALIILEDMEGFLTHRCAFDNLYDMLCNIIDLQRKQHRSYLPVAVTHRTFLRKDEFERIKELFSSFTHIVFFYGSSNISALDLPPHVAREVKKRIQLLRRWQYFILVRQIGSIQYALTDISDSRDPHPLIDSIVNASALAPIPPSQAAAHPRSTPSAVPPSVEPKRMRIIRMLRDDPYTSYRELAERLNTTVNFVCRVVYESKRDGLLADNKYYGAHRRNKLICSLQTIGE